MLQKPTVLIVDDSPMMCRFLGLFLEKKFEVISYTDSVEALSFIKEGFSPDLIITDLNMPGMDGYELIKALRQALPVVPILVVSGAKESNERIKALQVGGNDFLMKPFHPAELDVRVSKLIEKSTLVEQKSQTLKHLFNELKNIATFL